MVPVVCIDQTDQDAKQSALAAPAGSDEHGGFARTEIDRRRLEHLQRAE